LQVSSAFEFGGTSEMPRTRDNFWYRAFATDSEPDRGLIMYVAKRPRTKKNAEPHPTVRVMRPNPNGMLYAKIKSGELIVETKQEFTARMLAMAEDGIDVEAEMRQAGLKK
jgi:hypothetical protein